MPIRLRKTPAIAVAALVVVAAAAAVASATTDTITITTPKAGSSVTLHTTPYTAVAGDVSFAAATPQTTRFYLRRDGCGTSNDNPRLSVTSGTDAGDGCGLVITSVVGVGGNVDQSALVDFPASDGMPLALDASRAATGVIDIEGTAAGLTEVDVSLDALVNGQGVDVGSDSETVVLDPTVGDNAVPFTIQPSASLAGADLQALDLRVHIQGPSVDGGYIGLSGKSYLDMPAYSASVNRSVQVSVDDPSFSSPVPARLDQSGSTWSVAIPTPAAGRHTIYAEATQGFDTTAPVATTFTVKR
jgi:hypothetical protein